MSVLVPLQAPFAPLPSTSGEKAPVRFKFWHETLIDLMLQHPDWTVKQLATELGKTPVTLGYVMRSDMFRARFALRRDEHNERISYSIIAKQQGIATKVLTQLEEKLDDNAVSKKISARDLADIANETLERIGLGAKRENVNVTVQQNNNSVTVSSDALSRARAKLRSNESILTGREEINIVDVMADDSPRAPILDELMSIGDNELESSPEGENLRSEAPESDPAESAAPAGRGEGEG